jgi:hypothetical protein
MMDSDTKKEPFRITVEQYDSKCVVEVDYSEVSIYVVAEMLRKVLLASGWSINQIKEILITED